MITTVIRKFLRMFGYDIIKKSEASNIPHDGGALMDYVAEAQEMGMDINDYLEQNQQWPAALPLLQQVVFPYISEHSVVCEVGSGTGRHARHLQAKLTAGQLYLVDRSQQLTHFLQEYFQATSHVHARAGNGWSLPFEDEIQFDTIFANGVFITQKLNILSLYIYEFHRALKVKGYCIFNYIDPMTPNGWKHFTEQSQNFHTCFTYHSSEIVDKLLLKEGFKIIDHMQGVHNTYVICQKCQEDLR